MRGSVLVKLLSFIFLAITTSCSNKDEVSKITGLWVSSDFKSDTASYSLSIHATNDSIREIYGEIEGVVVTNFLGVNKDDYAIFDTIPDHFEARYPFDDFPFAFDLSMSHDTLIQVLNDKSIVKYVRADYTKAYQDLLFSDSELRLQIPQWRNEFERMHFEQMSLLTHIYVGKLKKSFIPKVPEYKLDSTIIQVDDIFINFEDIPKWINHQKDLLSEASRDSIRVLVVADKDVSENFLKRLGRILKKDCSPNLIGRGYVDWTKQKVLYRKSDPSLFLNLPE